MYAHYVFYLNNRLSKYISDLPKMKTYIYNYTLLNFMYMSTVSPP